MVRVTRRPISKHQAWATYQGCACLAYVKWAELELEHCHFLYNIVTNGKGTGTKNVLKWNRALGFEFSIQSSVYGATTVAKLVRCVTGV